MTRKSNQESSDINSLLMLAFSSDFTNWSPVACIQ